MRSFISVVLLCIVLTACSDRQIAKGDRGEQGPPGPPGPSGTTIRMSELDCKGDCAFTCGPQGAILNAYVLGMPSGRLVFENSNRVVFLSGTNVPIKIVLACIPS
jgi:hypothetical protein